MIRWKLPKSDRGASLIEVGIVIPMLILLGVGLTEVGFLVVDYVTVTNSARSGARTGAAAADSSLADEEILQVVEEDACNLKFGELVRVTIYLADTTDGSVPADTSKFMRYEPAGALDCDHSDHNLAHVSGTWVSTSRDNTLPTLDKIGVQVEFSHEKVTNLVPFGAADWSERAVMQLEPDTRG